MPWVQVYDPVHSAWLSTLAAALPILVLLITLGIFEWRAHRAVGAALVTALAVSVGIFGMPASAALAAAISGAAYGILPIGWIVVTAVFLYHLTVRAGQFDVLRAMVTRVSTDRRIQALLIGLDFSPLYAAGLSLIANTAPVAFGAIGIPILTLASVTGLSAHALGAMAGRQLPFMSLLIPAWLVVTMSGWKGLRGVWPAVLVSGASFAIVQFAWSNFIGPELVDVAGGLISLGALGLFCRFWKPRDVWEPGAVLRPTRDRQVQPIAHGEAVAPGAVGASSASHRRSLMAMVPWLCLSGFVLAWGLPSVKATLNGGPGTFLSKAIVAPAFDVPALHLRVYREFPVERDIADRTRLADAAYAAKRAEPARFTFNWLSATGTAILLAALASAMLLRVRPSVVLDTAWTTLRQMRVSLLTIALMLALGYVTRYGGTDATLGLAFTHTGRLYPLFATLVGWLGVALTGSDTSSNVLFGSLQKITAQQLHLNPILICTANSTGGVMGKMIDAQTIVISTAATGQKGGEGRVLRFVFWHSVALALLMGLIVLAQAYLFPGMIPDR